MKAEDRSKLSAISLRDRKGPRIKEVETPGAPISYLLINLQREKLHIWRKFMYQME